MKKKLLQRRLIVKQSSIHGYGVFAAEDIKKGDIIEECYVLPTDESIYYDNYRFRSDYGLVLPLGYGALYNHSNEPNASFVFCLQNSILVFNAKKAIKRGEEICIHYGSAWFANRDIQCKDVPAATSRHFPIMKPVLRFTILVMLLLLIQKMFVM